MKKINNDDNTENDADNDVSTGNVDSDSNQQKIINTPRINKIAFNTMPKSEALRTLKVFVGSNASKLRSNYKMLARKYHP